MNTLMFLEHAKTDLHKKRVIKSIKAIDEVLKKCSNSYVSMSGGKDSTVVYALVSSMQPNVRVVHHDDEFSLKVTRDYLSKFDNLEILKTEAHHTPWFITNRGENDLKNLDFDGCFLGLRAQENSYRKRHLANYGLIYESKGKTFCNPIAWWKTVDVWAYILSNNIAYNRAYDVMNEKGIPVEKQRIGPFANDKAIGYGQLQILKKCFPKDFNKFCKQYPKARAYV